MPSLREKLAAPDAFVIAAELVTSRGMMSQHTGKALFELSHQLAADERFDLL
jgi:hypothetical protein